MQGKYHDQFQVDWYQGGAGTSTNMNANEVMANIALELTGHKKGDYKIVEPHDHLNMSQSTNDSYPTAIKVALLLRNDRLIGGAGATWSQSFRAEGRSVHQRREDGAHRAAGRGADDRRPGVPRLRVVAGERDRLLREAEKHLYAVNMGATAIGTGLNAPEGYAERTAAHLAKLTGKPIVPAKDMLAATWEQQGFVVYSSALKSTAIKLSKIASDLILLTSGPRAGLAEINLPAMQPGSSIMPGKVNPVDARAGQPRRVPRHGQRLHRHPGRALRPAAAQRLRAARRPGDDGVAASALHHLADVPHRSASTASRSTRRCSTRYMETTVGIVTALNPVLGYEKATELANEAYKSGKGILEIIREQKLLTEAADRRPARPGEAGQAGQSHVPEGEARNRSGPTAHLRGGFIMMTVTHDSDLRRTRRSGLERRSRLQAQSKQPNIAILATGGTIAGAAATGTQSGYKSGAVEHRHDDRRRAGHRRSSPPSRASRLPTSARRTCRSRSC